MKKHIISVLFCSLFMATICFAEGNVTPEWRNAGFNDYDASHWMTDGFSEDFVLAERNLCERDEAGEIVRDGTGNPVLECMCGNILRGRTDPTLPFFTEGGTFWTNCTTELPASTTEKECQARTRNRCNGMGFETVALIPLGCARLRMACLPTVEDTPDAKEWE